MYKITFAFLCSFMLSFNLAAQTMREAPVATGFKSVPMEEETSYRYQERVIIDNNHNQISGDYIVYQGMQEFANYYCPPGNLLPLGRKFPHYGDDYPMFETFAYEEMPRCGELYYPNNFRVPK